jgi:hypothetical protein
VLVPPAVPAATLRGLVAGGEAESARNWPPVSAKGSVAGCASISGSPPAQAVNIKGAINNMARHAVGHVLALAAEKPVNEEGMIDPKKAPDTGLTRMSACHGRGHTQGYRRGSGAMNRILVTE